MLRARAALLSALRNVTCRSSVTAWKKFTKDVQDHRRIASTIRRRNMHFVTRKCVRKWQSELSHRRAKRAITQQLEEKENSGLTRSCFALWRRETSFTSNEVWRRLNLVEGKSYGQFLNSEREWLLDCRVEHYHHCCYEENKITFADWHITPGAENAVIANFVSWPKKRSFSPACGSKLR